GVPLTPVAGPRVLVAPGEDRAARTRELIRAALEVARGIGLSSVHVLFPSKPELGLLEEEGFSIRHVVQYQWRNRGYRSYEDFLTRFRAKRRHQLRRERRAAAAQGLELRTLRGEALAAVDPDDVYRLHQATVDRHGWGSQRLDRAFFEKVLRGFRRRVEV